MRRSKLDIIYDILVSIQNKNGKIKPTHLLYKSNLSYQRMQTYLAELIENGLVKEVTEGNKKYYELSEKGYQFLSEFKKINEFTKSFGV